MTPTPTIIGAHADVRPGDYRFARVRSDDIPLEKSGRLVSRGQRIVETIGLVIAMFAFMWCIGHLGVMFGVGQ